MKAEEFEAAIQNWDLPLVIKPGDELPTAGGYGVMICYNEADLKKATNRIKEASDTKIHYHRTIYRRN